MAEGQLALHTLSQGTSGLPLVLLHAFPLDHRMWLDVRDLLPGTMTILAPDLPGLGESPAGRDLAEHYGDVDVPSLDVTAKALAETLRAAGVERAVVAGLSMGGYVALALAEVAPDLVAGLGLINSKAAADTPEAAADRQRLVERIQADGDVIPLVFFKRSMLSPANRSERPDLAERLARWILDQGVEGCAWSQQAMGARPDRSDVLAGFDGPVLLVRGEDDESVPADEVRAMAESTADARVVSIPRTGHIAAIENPEPVASALADLWQRSQA